jgi:hypothetical protein
MAGCDPRPRRRSLGVGAVAVAAALAGAVAAPPIGHAQPAPDLDRAKELYASAEAAMKDGRFDDAARDYGAAYEVSKDPALFYKIARAHESAGRCETALIYYARYLREGKPGEQFAALTRERIAVCQPTPPVGAAPDTLPEPTPDPEAATPEPAQQEPPRKAEAAAPPASAAEPASPPASKPAPTLIPPAREKVAWLLGGSAIAFATLGGVLAYAASSAESDVRDLYAGLAGQVPAFDGATRKRYDDLVDQGHRYQHLSWAAFGLAGAAAVGAAVLFAIGRDDEPAQRSAIAPIVGPRSAGVSVRF